MKRVLLLLLLLAATSVLADDGRIPLFEPTIINEPGHYVLTRNVSIPTDIAFTIMSDDVTLDLGGWTVDSALAVYMSEGRRGVTIRNGRIIGGQHGVFHDSTTVAGQLRIEDLVLDGQDTALLLGDLAVVEIARCRISNAAADGIVVTGFGNDSFSGRVVDTTVRFTGGYGIRLAGIGSGQVARNIVFATGQTTPFVSGIVLEGISIDSGGTIVAENTVYSTGSDCSGIVVTQGSHGNKIHHNVVRAAGGNGIHLLSSGNDLSDNAVTMSEGDGVYVSGGRNLLRRNTLVNNSGDGIEAAGQMHLIDGNNFSGNGGYGLNLVLSGLTAYRNNYTRDNGIGPIGGAVGGNTDAGGNL